MGLTPVQRRYPAPPPRPSPRQSAVDLVNRVRRDFDLDPVPDLVPGIRKDSCRCPIAATIEFGARNLIPIVTTTEVRVRTYLATGIPSSPRIYPMGDDAARFVDAFDGGGYSDLHDDSGDWERWV